MSPSISKRMTKYIINPAFSSPIAAVLSGDIINSASINQSLTKLAIKTKAKYALILDLKGKIVAAGGSGKAAAIPYIGANVEEVLGSGLSPLVVFGYGQSAAFYGKGMNGAPDSFQSVTTMPIPDLRPGVGAVADILNPHTGVTDLLIVVAAIGILVLILPHV